MPKPFFNSNLVFEQIIRVNHAGEFGAKIIYNSQIKFTKDEKQKELIKHMMNQEEEHLSFFLNEMIKNNVRPTLLMPIWYCIGYILGSTTALIGKNISMLLTESIESVIENHYADQIEYLSHTNNNENLKNKLIQFRLEEIEHKNIAIENDSKQTFCYKIINSSIKKLCKVAITLSKII